MLEILRSAQDDTSGEPALCEEINGLRGRMGLSGAKQTAGRAQAPDVAGRFTEEFGDAWITSGAGSHRVDGMAPATVASPPSRDAAAALVARAEELGLAVIPRGNGTHAHVGNCPRRYD